MMKRGRPIPTLDINQAEREHLHSILRRRQVAQADALRASPDIS
jgi:hypothetical protein